MKVTGPQQFSLKAMFATVFGASVWLMAACAPTTWQASLILPIAIPLLPALCGLGVLSGRGITRAFCLGAMVPGVMGVWLSLDPLSEAAASTAPAIMSRRADPMNANSAFAEMLFILMQLGDSLYFPFLLQGTAGAAVGSACALAFRLAIHKTETAGRGVGEILMR